MAAGGPGPAQVRPRGPFNRVPAGGAAAFSFFAVLLRLGGVSGASGGRWAGCPQEV